MLGAYFREGAIFVGACYWNFTILHDWRLWRADRLHRGPRTIIESQIFSRPVRRDPVNKYVFILVQGGIEDRSGSPCTRRLYSPSGDRWRCESDSVLHESITDTSHKRTVSLRCWTHVPQNNGHQLQVSIIIISQNNRKSRRFYTKQLRGVGGERWQTMRYNNIFAIS